MILRYTLLEQQILLYPPKAREKISRRERNVENNVHVKGGVRRRDHNGSPTNCTEVELVLGSRVN